ncbi:hypothetical protein [Tepidicella baoligensis]|uniref:hypothetical protein n=1 Tax=Tepidicella baoligensis TaxID=2707016 RepID=UPI0015D98260|nr:hypothetical protein [Tepidicella baoligensis]
MFLTVMSIGGAHAWTPCPGYAAGDPTQTRSLFVSPYTHHWRHSDDHKHVVLIGVQRQLPNDRLCGISLFSNSFGQPSLYAFTGWYWPQVSSRHPRLYASLSAGVLYGYVGEHKDKVPLNVGGFSPALIPAIGWRLNQQTSAEVHVLGTAALLFGVSRRY